MPVIFCKKCGVTSYLDPHAYWTINDAAVQCEKCQAVNTIILEDGKLKNRSKLPEVSIAYLSYLTVRYTMKYRIAAIL
jgi:hypothetical protein